MPPETIRSVAEHRDEIAAGGPVRDPEPNAERALMTWIDACEQELMRALARYSNGP